MPKSSEVAQLVVAGTTFEDWETVWVQHRWADGWPLFRFTAAERAPLPTLWTSLQFKPGDLCTILLGGQLAITGVVLERQTAYDAGNHSVQLSGAGMTWGAATSSVDSKDGNFDRMSLKPIADKVTAPFGVNVLAVGQIDATPFDRLQAQPGELVFDFLDRIARVRGVTLGSDHLGNLLLIGQHSNPIVQQLTEGENILKMQCVVSNEKMSSVYATTGQKAVEDGTGMRESAEMQAKAQGSLKNIFKFLETVTEQPVKNQSELEARANYESVQREGTLIIAYVTVQGWLRDGKNLWRTGNDVWVYSPMAMLNMAMKIQTATFTQDSKSGTTTTLELVLPWRLADKPFGTTTGPADTAPQPPPPATTSSDKPPVDPKPPPGPGTAEPPTDL
jgi:prophage tail gpP-like protein